MLALMENGTQPKRISLREMIGAFISFRLTNLTDCSFPYVCMYVCMYVCIFIQN